MATTTHQIVNLNGFAGRLLRARTLAGKSQRELSGPGLSYAYISRLESGSRTPSLSAVAVLARKLEVDPSWLATGNAKTPCPFCGRND